VLEKCCYFVTSIEAKDPENHHPDIRCWGFFESEADALESVKGNLGDMHETIYTHVVIEKITEGILSHPENQTWFKWEGDAWKGTWTPCSKPQWAEGICGWAIG